MTGRQGKIKRIDNKVEKAQIQIEQLQMIRARLESIKTDLKDKQKARLELLTSAVTGQYEEMDKLSKKAPAEKVTDLALGEVNYIIAEIKEFLSDDVIVQRFNPFVPAGDNPELRDVVLVLRQLIQGLKRFDDSLSPKTSKIDSAMKEIRALREVLANVIDGQANLSYDSSELSRSSKDILNNGWFEEDPPRRFLYEKLEETNVEEYFREYVN